MKIAREAQKQAPKSPVGHALEGDVLMAEKKFAQAGKAYDAAYALGRSGAIVMRAHAAYTQAGRSEDAEARLNQWLKGAPDDPVVRLYAADASLRSGNYKRAIEHYERLLQRQPENIVALNNLAWCYQQVKDPRAVATAERAYKLKPDNPAVADTLGWMLVEQGNVRRGVELLREAAKRAPKAAEVRYHYAQALVRNGDRGEARKELEGLLADFPAFPQHKQALAMLQDLRK
jgi:putative PEP-CTERM system TPR-repeat lipoprotein